MIKRVLLPIDNSQYRRGGHSPSLKCFRLQLRGIVLRSQKRKHFGEGGQTIIEYATFIVVVVMALLAMQVYFKRGIQGKMRDMADQISPVLYNSNFTESNFTTKAWSRSESFYSEGAFSQDVVYDASNRTGRQVTHPETVDVN